MSGFVSIAPHSAPRRSFTNDGSTPAVAAEPDEFGARIIGTPRRRSFILGGARMNAVETLQSSSRSVKPGNRAVNEPSHGRPRLPDIVLVDAPPFAEPLRA